MNKKIAHALAASAAALALAAMGPAADPLPSWNDTAPKERIIAFVDAVTREGSPDHVPAPDRIAVFDNDGTLWSEMPAYFQLLFAIDRVKAMAPAHPEWRTTQPFKVALDGDMAALAEGGEKGLLQLVMATHAGMTTDEFESAVRDWMVSARHPATGRRFAEMVYQPMLELLAYLRANGFRTWIVSGGGIEFVRVFAPELYGIPPEQVIGSSIRTEFEMRADRPVIVRKAELDFIDDKAGKPVAIQKFIGRRPIAAFGNSDGDLQMLQWTAAGEGARFCLLVHHTDAEREWAYDLESHIGRLDAALTLAQAKGWTVIDMKRDWRTVFPAFPAPAREQAPPRAAPAEAGPPGMVWVPGGEFTMGWDGPEARPDETPAHRVWVDGFWIDATEVTNAEFRRFVDATGYVTTAEQPVDWEKLKEQLPPGTPRPAEDVLVPGALVFTPPDHAVDRQDYAQWWTWTAGASWRHPQGPGSSNEGMDDHPVVHVSWDDAVAYAAWAGKRLPTEAEWERAARLGHDGERYVWGSELMPGGRHMANIWQGEFPYADTAADGFAAAAPVRSFAPNAAGLFDMAGNVWEWTADQFRPDMYAQRVSGAADGALCVNPRGPDTTADPRNPYASDSRVQKGGSFLCHASYCASYRPSAKMGCTPDTGMSHVGFRCVRDAAGFQD
jgi:formylglycine-generating enzyme required for sulfatase activity